MHGPMIAQRQQCRCSSSDDRAGRDAAHPRIHLLKVLSVFDRAGRDVRPLDPEDPVAGAIVQLPVLRGKKDVRETCIAKMATRHCDFTKQVSRSLACIGHAKYIGSYQWF